MPLSVLEERRREREEKLSRAKKLAEKLRERLGPVTLAVYGSYARGDFGEWSDVDLVVVSERFRGVRFTDRYGLFEDLLPGGFEAKPYTPEELRQLAGKPAWAEALRGAIVVADDYSLLAPRRGKNGSRH